LDIDILKGCTPITVFPKVRHCVSILGPALLEEDSNRHGKQNELENIDINQNNSSDENKRFNNRERHFSVRLYNDNLRSDR